MRKETKPEDHGVKPRESYLVSEIRNDVKNDDADEYENEDEDADGYILCSIFIFFELSAKRHFASRL